MSKQDVKVKKVSPYPIEAELVGTTENRKGLIVKLTPNGFLIEVDSVSVRLGLEFKVKFTIPLTDRHIEELVKVVKVYDRQRPPVEGEAKPQVYRLAEMHFLAISLAERKWIREFMIAISQAPERV